MSDVLEIITCEQGSPEWAKSRLGIPTASEFAAILTKGRGGAESRTRLSYLYKLVGERLTGEPAETISTFHMERGKLMEDEACSVYGYVAGASCERIGFLRRGRAGASPDALIGHDGLLEIKTKLPHLMVETILRGEFPLEHKAQCQGQLWIAQREWIDIAVYWPGLPIFITRAGRDEAYIRDLADAVDAFNTELDLTVDRVRSYGLAKPA
ncbi:lambda exonuclease family protein [Bosea sp. 124]|uniref:lambda exonuclease family protein n=1 Tax=Bosea sp. 124 TaxID=2135642 RepID=UPI000D472E62|nr:lambda exonuclease family protein [Bosea sp. 124]PTM40313.1 YqaJ-like recombinase protein [Bosea sp. 124]